MKCIACRAITRQWLERSSLRPSASRTGLRGTRYLALAALAAPPARSWLAAISWPPAVLPALAVGNAPYRCEDAICTQSTPSRRPRGASLRYCPAVAMAAVAVIFGGRGGEGWAREGCGSGGEGGGAEEREGGQRKERGGGDGCARGGGYARGRMCEGRGRCTFKPPTVSVYVEWRHIMCGDSISVARASERHSYGGWGVVESAGGGGWSRVLVVVGGGGWWRVLVVVSGGEWVVARGEEEEEADGGRGGERRGANRQAALAVSDECRGRLGCDPPKRSRSLLTASQTGRRAVVGWAGAKPRRPRHRRKRPSGAPILLRHSDAYKASIASAVAALPLNPHLITHHRLLDSTATATFLFLFFAECCCVASRPGDIASHPIVGCVQPVSLSAGLGNKTE